MQWDPQLWSQLTVDAEPVWFLVDESGKKFRWSQSLREGQIDHSFSFQNDAPTGSTGAPQIPDEILLRVLCHVMTNWMPNEALPELGEAMGDMYRFYRDRGVAADTSYLPIYSSELEILDPIDRPLFKLGEE